MKYKLVIATAECEGKLKHSDMRQLIKHFMGAMPKGSRYSLTMCKEFPLVAAKLRLGKGGSL